ncbi:MAG: hypothetical protein OEM52_03615 [bacterium]|nr:hypothetical protein [bacterium]
MRIRYGFLITFILLSFLIFGCAKEDASTTNNPNSPAVDLTRNDCIGCHTNEDALKATLDDSASTAALVGPIASNLKYANRAASEG